MPGKGKAVQKGAKLVNSVASLGEHLGLIAVTNYRAGRRIWGARRFIDVVLIHQVSRKTLGVECKFQESSGSAEEKIPATIKDIEAWPIQGLVVFSGRGFTENMKAFLLSTGKAVEFDELKPWLCLFFGLPLAAERGRKKVNESNGDNFLPGL